MLPASEITCDRDQAVNLAVETLWRFLAAALRDPSKKGTGILRDPASQQMVRDAANFLREEFQAQNEPLGFGELDVEGLDVESLVEWLCDSARSLEDEHVKAFGLVICTDCPPYETEYLPNEDTFFRTQQMADVAGFYRAFGLQPDPRERPDHISLELEFMAYLLMMERLGSANGTADDTALDVCQEARAKFLKDHLTPWLTSFAIALESKVQTDLFALVGRCLRALVPIERRRLSVPPPEVPVSVRLTVVQEDCDSCAGCDRS